MGIAAAVVGGGVASSAIGAAGSESAAQTAASASNQAAATQLAMFNTTQQNLSPYMQSGSTANNALNTYMGINSNGTINSSAPGQQQFSAAQYQQSPGYQWQLQQGLGAIENSASNAGGIVSGNTLKALQTYGQGLANQDYQQAYQNYTANQQNMYNELSGIKTAGQNAAANLGTTSANVGSSVAANQTAAGSALASGTLGVTNALSGATNNISNLALANSLSGGAYY